MSIGAIGVESKKSFVIVEVASVVVVSVEAVPITAEVSITLVIIPLKPYFIRVPRKTTSREPLQPTIDLWRSKGCTRNQALTGFTLFTLFGNSLRHFLSSLTKAHNFGLSISLQFLWLYTGHSGYISDISYPSSYSF